MDEFIITEAKNAQAQIDAAEETATRKIDIISMERVDSAHLFKSKIEEIEVEMRIKDLAFQDRQEEVREAATEEQERFYPMVDRYREVLRLIDVARKYRKEHFDPNVYLNSLQCNGPLIRTIYQSPFLMLNVYVVKNNRPVNKFQIEVVGRSIFPRTMVLLPNDVKLAIAAPASCNIHFKDRISDNVEFLEGRAYNLREPSFLKEHKEMEQKLTDVLEGKYDSREWQTAYLEDKIYRLDRTYQSVEVKKERDEALIELEKLQSS